MIKELRVEIFEKEISEGVSVIGFYTNWCTPCKMMRPMIEEIYLEVPDIQFYKIDVEKEIDLAMRFHIISVPTILIFKDGKIINRAEGMISKKELLELL